VTAFQSSRLLLELSTADEEWAEWGNEADEKTESVLVVTNDLNRAAGGNDGFPEESDAHDSDSDEDGQDGVTFLTLGSATKPARTARDNGLAATLVSILPTAADAALSITSDIIEGDDEDVDVEWEDCKSEDDRSGNEVYKYSPEVEVSVERQIEPSAIADSSKSSPTPSVNGEDPLAIIDSSSESVSDDDDFDAPLDDPQAAALKRAQATASNLTSWAGRAFQRAISELAADQAQPNSSNRNPHQANTEKEKIELGDDHEGIDADRGRKAQNEIVGASTDDNHHSPASPHRINKQPYFLDTSLEGLTEAHNAILEEEKTMERDMSTITDEMKEDILTLLQLCGIPWVESPSEAEAQCAALEELGLVDGIVTEDSDIFVFGGKKVYKNFFDEQKYVEAYFAKDIERDLALKRHQLVALAMLLGGDYTDGVKGVGIVNGMEVLQAFAIHDSDEGIRDGLHRFREWLDGFDDPSLDDCEDVSSHRVALFHKKHKYARTRWVAPSDFPSRGIINAYLNPVVDKSEAEFSWSIPNLQGLQHFCAETLGWERAETDRVVNPVLKVLDSGSTQMRLESYFLRYEDGYKFAKVKSKRLKAVLHDIQSGDTADTVERDNTKMVTSNTKEVLLHKN
jgi:DNA excision repair protein ERCC-5